MPAPYRIASSLACGCRQARLPDGKSCGEHPAKAGEPCARRIFLYARRDRNRTAPSQWTRLRAQLHLGGRPRRQRWKHANSGASHGDSARAGQVESLPANLANSHSSTVFPICDSTKQHSGGLSRSNQVRRGIRRRKVQSVRSSNRRERFVPALKYSREIPERANEAVATAKGAQELPDHFWLEQAGSANHDSW